MEIFKESENLTTRERLALTVGKGHLSLSDILDDTPIEVKSYIVFQQDGSDNRCISIRDSQGTIYSGISKPFIDSFLAFADEIPQLLAEEGKLEIVKMTAASKSNRKYVMCSIV